MPWRRYFYSAMSHYKSIWGHVRVSQWLVFGLPSILSLLTFNYGPFCRLPESCPSCSCWDSRVCRRVSDESTRTDSAWELGIAWNPFSRAILCRRPKCADPRGRRKRSVKRTSLYKRKLLSKFTPPQSVPILEEEGKNQWKEQFRTHENCFWNLLSLFLSPSMSASNTF